MYLINNTLEIVVYGEVRGGNVYYRVTHTSGKLNCYYKKKGSSSWNSFSSGASTKPNGYAECSSWTKGNPSYDIKLELNGKKYFTDEETAISRGPHTSGNVHKIKVTNSRIMYLSNNIYKQTH